MTLPSAEEVEARLAEVERLRRERWPRRAPPDMSEAAVTARLRSLAQLLRLCRALGA